MARERLAEADFVREFETKGPAKLAADHNLDVSAVFARRRRLEAKLKRQITGPTYPTQTRYNISHPKRIEMDVPNGIVLVGSDGHYWPDEISTAHRAFVEFAREYKPKAIILNGDAFDGASISRHPPIGWTEQPTVQEEIEAVEARLAELASMGARGCRKIWTLGNHDCLDPATQCLTRRGWVDYTDIRQDDQVLSLDDGTPTWSPIDQIVSGPYKGDMVRVEKTRFSMSVTENHRVLLRRLNWRTQHFDIEEYRSAGDLPYSFDVPVTGQTNLPGVDLTNDQIALAGWLITDGHQGQYNWSLFQSKPVGRAAIEGLLDRLGLAHSLYERQRNRKAICGRKLKKQPLLSAQYHLTAEASREVTKFLPDKRILPEWVLDLSPPQFQVFLDALIAGDGVWDGAAPEKKTCGVLYGTPDVLEQVQAVAVLHGWRARLSRDTRGAYRLCLAKEPKIRVEKPEVFREPYEGEVWCLRVPLGNFMVRRNGCAYFTGNSRFETRIATVAPQYAKVHGSSLKDHFPVWEPCWSVFINDNTVIKHRFKGGIHATHNNAIWSGKHIITGHLHSAKVTPFTDYNGTRYGVDTGCLADPDAQAFDYTEDNPKNWRSGFAVLTFKDGQLLMPELVTRWDEDTVQFRGELIRV